MQNTGFESIVSEFATKLTRMSLKTLLTKLFSTCRKFLLSIEIAKISEHAQKSILNIINLVDF